MPTCEQCGKEFYAGDGAWDNGDYMCGECIAGHIEDAGRKEQKSSSDNPLPNARPQSTPKK